MSKNSLSGTWMSMCTGCRDLLEVPKHTIKIVFGSSFILYFLKLLFHTDTWQISRDKLLNSWIVKECAIRKLISYYRNGISFLDALNRRPFRKIKWYLLCFLSKKIKYLGTTLHCYLKKFYGLWKEDNSTIIILKFETILSILFIKIIATAKEALRSLKHLI